MDGPILAEVEVPGPAGIHARPCHAIVSVVARFEAEVKLISSERSADAKSVLALMTLGAMPGETVLLEAQGKEAKEVLAALKTMFREGFEQNS